jgi:hypothetical protein
MDSTRYRQQLKREAKRLSVPSFATTDEILETITHAAASDLLAKVESGVAGPKDFQIYLKLVEGHCKLETVKLKREEVSQAGREEALRVLEKLGLTREQIEALEEEPLTLEEADAESEEG